MSPIKAAIWIFKFVGTLALLFAIPVVLFYGGLFTFSTAYEKYQTWHAHRQEREAEASCTAAGKKWLSGWSAATHDYPTSLGGCHDTVTLDLSQAIPLADIPSRVHAQQCAEAAKLPLLDRAIAETKEKERSGEECETEIHKHCADIARKGDAFDLLGEGCDALPKLTQCADIANRPLQPGQNAFDRSAALDKAGCK